MDEILRLTRVTARGLHLPHPAFIADTDRGPKGKGRLMRVCGLRRWNRLQLSADGHGPSPSHAMPSSDRDLNQPCCNQRCGNDQTTKNRLLFSPGGWTFRPRENMEEDEMLDQRQGPLLPPPSAPRPRMGPSQNTC